MKILTVNSYQINVRGGNLGPRPLHVFSRFLDEEEDPGDLKVLVQSHILTALRLLPTRGSRRPNDARAEAMQVTSPIRILLQYTLHLTKIPNKDLPKIGTSCDRVSDEQRWQDYIMVRFAVTRTWK